MNSVVLEIEIKGFKNILKILDSGVVAPPLGNLVWILRIVCRKSGVMRVHVIIFLMLTGTAAL